MSKFSKKDIEKAFEDFNNPETHKIIQNLIDRTFKSDKMTQAEIQRACSLMEYSRAKDHDFEFNIYEYDACKDYIFRKLPVELKGILEKLGSNTVINKQSIKFIPLRFNGNIYSMWTQKVTKHEKGKGKIEYIQLETFYPTEVKDEFEKIKNEFTEIKIDDQLSGFIKKIT